MCEARLFQAIAWTVSARALKVSGVMLMGSTLGEGAARPGLTDCANMHRDSESSQRNEEVYTTKRLFRSTQTKCRPHHWVLVVVGAARESERGQAIARRGKAPRRSQAGAWGPGREGVASGTSPTKPQRS